MRYSAEDNRIKQKSFLQAQQGKRTIVIEYVEPDVGTSTCKPSLCRPESHGNIHPASRQKKGSIWELPGLNQVVGAILHQNHLTCDLREEKVLIVIAAPKSPYKGGDIKS